MAARGERAVLLRRAPEPEEEMGQRQSRVEQTAVRPSSGRLLAWSLLSFRLHRCPLHRTILLLLVLCPELPRSHNLKPSLPPIVTDRPFLVAWNAPTARCWTSYEVPLSVASFSLLANAQEDFTGGNITIFYYDQLGLYPYYLNKTTPPVAINGGCPQNTSLLDHLDKMASDIATAMPSASFAGLSVIDWENWRPQWIRNWDKKNVYRTMSTQLVRLRNPRWPDEQVELEAKWEFETAAARFMAETLKLAQLLRPGGWWGYYLFPECYNYHYWDDFENFTGGCPQVEVQRNNKLLWLWEQSKALYPSIYMEEVLKASPQGKKFVQAKLSEALRVAQLPSVNHSLPVFAYARPFYSYTLKELTQTDLVHTIGQAAAMGAHGIVLWGGVEYSRNRPNCVKIQKYLTGTLGPYIINVTTATKLCSQFVCNNHGRCLRRKMDLDSYLHLDASSFQIRVDKAAHGPRVSVKGALTTQQRDRMRQEFTCHCYQGWRGEHCNSRGHSNQLWAWDLCIPMMVMSAMWMWGM
ncbi:hyaluronidase-4-like [Gopherus flavomarginatus]|uniref:hyaluronidase-4-like n=1 Tax=Gopherus flavomarginatus TaxID=286002 RepID=UPI0021CBEEEC|nr:hyaluronidase-4-like [Gopherus flavomarginatus]